MDVRARHLSTTVVVCGKNRIAVDCLRHLARLSKVKIALVVGASGDDGKDGWQPSLIREARLQKFAVLTPHGPRDPRVDAAIARVGPDFLFSFQYDFILSQQVLSAPTRGAVNLHFGPLPRYRGVSTIAWQLINAEKTAGVTLHHMDAGIDTGDIIAQTIFPIAENDNARDVYEKSMARGYALFKKNLPSVLAGTSARLPQEDRKSLYYGKGSIDFHLNEVCWKTGVRQLSHWMRAFIFPPFQYPAAFFNGKKFSLSRIKPIYRRFGFPSAGTVLKIRPHLEVSCNDGAIRIERTFWKKSEMTGERLARTLGIKKGDRLG